ncbi:three-helix bundle dimerization domain-containing protein [Williamsia sp.]|uniref:three-helix bundle dimerization domain-containing protein n=1 Tax=Williamsia sp. TaxID=1872085 RepID=UPI002F924A54
MHSIDEERQQIAQIVDKLTKRHDDLDPMSVTAAVDDAYQRFDGQPIRDFVPLLVERRAHDRLGSAATVTAGSVN